MGIYLIDSANVADGASGKTNTHFTVTLSKATTISTTIELAFF